MDGDPFQIHSLRSRSQLTLTKPSAPALALVVPRQMKAESTLGRWRLSVKYCFYLFDYCIHMIKCHRIWTGGFFSEEKKNLGSQIRHKGLHDHLRSVMSMHF